MRTLSIAVSLLISAFASLFAQNPPRAQEVQQYVQVDAPVFALTHVRVVDGTGAAAREDQTIVVDHGRIMAVGPAASTKVPAGAKELDYHEHTVIPGLVGMHDHLYYTASQKRDAQGNRIPPGFFLTEIPYTAPRLYLAAGVTTLRTTGSVEPYADLGVKQLIDSHQMPGPSIDATAPYLEGNEDPLLIVQLHPLSGPEDARRMVNFWAQTGFTSWKAYMYITRAELGAALEEVHKRGMKLSGHLCSVTWPEAIALGIDGFEHGPVFTDSEFVKDKKPDVCPPGLAGPRAWLGVDINSAPVRQLIQDLIAHRIAVTSTLPVFAAGLRERSPQQAALDAMAPESRASFLTLRAQTTPETNARIQSLLQKEMEFEYAFAKAGGLLLAGSDPTGNGGVLPGFGNWRELELLVEAGFTPVEAIHIATENGSQYLGQTNRIGTIAAGKQADLVVIHGDPASRIEDIEKVVLVFKDGVGYDSQKLFESVRGQVGIR